ncbi:Lathosterol oxidase [Gracilariopsis chorda]|uniref:Lathosterol oxidase n=1 Tax=Gracilariopsis chorda TaxID=448386 RepID=A0A2V3J3H7_9FLOR|nr:Lathosterol oxidase [Gracilariopsis chorda]|eukprot:PXF48945.1 Lathosterol oxidase [Gracilariopsis chorda]
MEALGITARLANLNAHHLVELLNDKLFDPILPSHQPLSISRRLFVTWVFLYFGSLIVYFTFASLDFLIHFRLLAHRCLPENYLQTTQVRREITTSVKSLSIMAAMTTPFEILIQLGYGKIYYDPAKYGYAYLFVSPLLFLAFSDCVIYFVHRALHHPLLYKTFHKPHHSFINTTPFAAFAFHPVDGFAQGLSYLIFVFLVPFHAVVHLASLVVVSCWTMNIHDRVTWRIPGVNGAAHHTIHHTTFKSNYGQYTTLWDKLCGTFRDPHQWKQAGSPTLTEKQVYGKHA